MADRAGQWPVAWTCEASEASEASASGYCAWAARADGPAECRRHESAQAIATVHADGRQRSGSPRMTAAWNARGHGCPEDAAAEPMRARGIRGETSRRFVRTTDSRHRLPAADDRLDRAFEPSGPNEARRADITYIPTREGWPYSAAVEDSSGRRTVGWSMGETTTGRLAVDALSMARARRRPGAGLPAHSDRGGRHASEHDQRVPTDEGVVCGASGVGPCRDNAPVESSFGSLKRESGTDAPYPTRDQARSEIFEYLGVFHDLLRRHSSPGYVSPDEFERAHNREHR